MAATITDYLSWLTNDKKQWHELSYEDQKNFNVYIVNRFFSMDLYLCDAVNSMQKYTVGMDKSMVWRVYYELLPKQKFYFKYIKAKKIEGVDEKTIHIFKKHFHVSDLIAIEYINLLKNKGLTQEIENLKNNYKYE